MFINSLILALSSSIDSLGIELHMVLKIQEFLIWLKLSYL